jgi:cation:H+ antiporter
MSAVTLVLFLAGLGLLVVGAELLVRGASKLAAAAGISPLIVGLTVVAFGTSAPELAVSVGSAYSGQADIAIGNVIGSNIFNVLLILGASSITSSIDADLSTIAVDLAVLGAMTIATAFVIRTRQQVSRPEAVVLLLGYVAFLSALALT